MTDVNEEYGMRCFEDILQETGWGLYNKYVLFFSLLSAFCCASALAANTFALPIAICDIELSRTQVVWINAILPLGMCFGVISFGVLSDIFCRRFVLSSTLTSIFISSFACGFCYEFFMFLFFTFLLGMSVSAQYAFVKVNLSEILPMKNRGYYLVLLDTFWIFGYVITSSINWTMRCSITKNYGENYTSWRMLYGFPCIICVLCICLHGILQPSPRMLLAIGRKIEAYLVLKYIFSINSSDHSDNCKITLVGLDHIIEDFGIDKEFTNSCKDQCILAKLKFRRIIRGFHDRKICCVLCFVSLIKCSLFIGFNMANIWMTKSLHVNVINCSFTILELLHFNNEDQFTDCTYLINATMFRDFILLATSGFVALLMFSYIIDKFGRNIPLSIVLIVFGVATTNFIFIDKYEYRFILSVEYMVGFAIANSILDLVILENLPTRIRSTGLAISLFFPNFEAFVFRLISHLECSIFYYIIGAFTIAVGVVGYFLPDRKRKPMRE